jgi:hypothetical protein
MIIIYCIFVFLLTNKTTVLIIPNMRNEKQIQMLPEKRTENTYRVVLQRFEPKAGPHGRYRDICSRRLEVDKTQRRADILEQFLNAVDDFVGTGKI